MITSAFTMNVMAVEPKDVGTVEIMFVDIIYSNNFLGFTCKLKNCLHVKKKQNKVKYINKSKVNN